MSTHVCNVILTAFDEKSGFDCYFLSAQCIECQAWTTGHVETWVFIPLNPKWRSFIDKVVYCNNFRSIKVSFLELEKAMYAIATPAPMFTIITPGPYTHSKQSKTFPAKCNMKVNCDKNRFDNQKWLYECYRSQSNCQINLP